MEAMKELVIRIPVKDGEFVFKKASVDGGEEIRPPYSLNVKQMFSIPLQIGTGSGSYAYLHFPDCRYIKVWMG